jgi:hypothetical protein
LETNIKKIICEYCNFEFTRIDSLKKHYNRCKQKAGTINVLQEKNEILEKKLEQTTEELNNIKSLLLEFMNKNCKVHPKQLQKINKQLNGNNNTINENNSTNNGTINNTFILGLGKENLPELFSKKEKLLVLNQKYNSLPYLVEYAHFNDKYPQCKNILITNTQNDLAHKYDEKKNQFVVVNKNELL